MHRHRRQARTARETARLREALRSGAAARVALARSPLTGALVVAPLLAVLSLAGFAATPSALAEEQATPIPSGTLVKFVILSRHGVRSPIPSLDELKTWTTNTSPWPTWYCSADATICRPGQLTPRGWTLAEQMGTYYGRHLSTLVPDQCPARDDVFFWADRDESTKRTKHTAIALLHGFRPSQCDTAHYFHEASTEPDRIFHPVGGPGCGLTVPTAVEAILSRVPNGDLTKYATDTLGEELGIAQGSLRCCQQSLCQQLAEKKCGNVPACLLPRLPTCLVFHPDKPPYTRVLLGGGLRIASTFTELMLLEYANGFESKDVGWGIDKTKMIQASRLHTAAFDLEQRTQYIAKLQGSRLLNKILLALQGKTDNKEGTAPPNAKFVAYVGHDTNISNVAAMLGLSWQQAGYQKNDTPPAGALIFEILQTDAGARNVYVYYTAQSLDDMRSVNGDRPVSTAVPIPGCGGAGSPCSLDQFAKLVEQVLVPNQDCWK
jgi:4-phytase/acid phosphatase